MEVMKLLEYLQDIIESSHAVPMTGKIMVSKKEVIEVIEKIINYLPDEFKKAQWVYEEKERILNDALAKADTINKQKLESVQKQIENHDVVREAENKANKIIANAQRDAKTIRLGARDYADDVLTQLEKQIDMKGTSMVQNIREEITVFVDNLEKNVSLTSDSIRENVKELRNMK